MMLTVIFDPGSGMDFTLGDDDEVLVDLDWVQVWDLYLLMMR